MNRSVPPFPRYGMKKGLKMRKNNAIVPRIAKI
jgi:hypothetical protein